MILLSDALAIDIGTRRNNAISEAQAWNHEAIRLGDLAWDYCAAREWPALELTFNGFRMAQDEETDDERDEYLALLQVAGAARSYRIDAKLGRSLLLAALARLDAAQAHTVDGGTR